MFKQMSEKYTVAAFSVVEAIIGMAITAIIMGIVFVIFSIVSERMLDYKNQNTLVNDLNRLTYSINKDIFDNEKMTVIDNKILFNGYSGEIVKYNFLEDYTLRSREEYIDTFKIKLINMIIDSVKSNTQKKVFLKLKLNVEVNESNLDLSFYKRVYANELLQKAKQ